MATVIKGLPEKSWGDGPEKDDPNAEVKTKNTEAKPKNPPQPQPRETPAPAGEPPIRDPENQF